LQVWVKHVNSRGGVNGHRVRLFVYDDGGDTARHRAQVQDAVEQRRVIGFLQNGETLTGAGSVEYLNAKRVPVVGVPGAEAWALQSPMYFPQGATADTVFEVVMAAPAGLLVPKGKTKVGWVVCVEAQGCADADRIWYRLAPGFGFQVVYRGKASLAQPDYTAECLAARSGGAEILILTLDAASQQRLAAACARQAYRPVFVTGGPIPVNRMKDDPNLEGMVASSTVFPWFQRGTSATEEFQRTMDQFATEVVGPNMALSWAAAKVFEKAATDLPEPPSSQALLRGLWSVKNDTFGGLTQPLTFIENQPSTPRACWWNLVITNRSWVSPDGFKAHCR
jgi:branched-chain amino acid transport system substrate-binding protein